MTVNITANITVECDTTAEYNEKLAEAQGNPIISNIVEDVPNKTFTCTKIAEE